MQSSQRNMGCHKQNKGTYCEECEGIGEIYLYFDKNKLMKRIKRSGKEEADNDRDLSYRSSLTCLKCGGLGA